MTKPYSLRRNRAVGRSAALISYLLVMFFGAVPHTCRAADPPPATAVPGLRASDVVFMYDGPKMYQEYGCTVLGWAGSHDKNHIAQAHKQGVRLFTVSVGFLTEFQGMIDFSSDFQDAAARNFAGETFIVPWLWDHKHKGEPAWWWCTNSPLYRQFLESRLRERMPAEPDGLHMRGTFGTSSTGETVDERHLRITTPWLGSTRVARPALHRVASHLTQPHAARLPRNMPIKAIPAWHLVSSSVRH